MDTKASSTAATNGSSQRGGYKLYVRNLPKHLEKDKIECMFQEFGIVMSCLSPRNGNYAYVSYSKYEEAEQAIKELHQKEPLNLDIQFVKENEEQAEIMLSNSHLDFRYQNLPKPYQPVKSIEMGKSRAVVPFNPDKYSSDDDLLYPVPTDSRLFNPYEFSEPYRETNLMYSKGVTSVTRDGRRMVRLGRGYTYYNIPEPHPKIADYTSIMNERRENGFYEYCVDPLEEENGPCQLCKTITCYKCHKCGIFYCSKQCQFKDWPVHKVQCEPMPLLVAKKIKSKEIEQNMSQNNENLPSAPAPLRRPKTSPPTDTDLSVDEVSNSLKSTKLNGSNKSLAESNSNGVEICGKSSLNRPKSNGSIQINIESIANGTHQELDKSKNITIQAAPTNLDKKVNDKAIKPGNKTSKMKDSDLNICFQEETFMPKDVDTTVIVTLNCGDGYYWIQKVSDSSVIEEISTTIEDIASKEPLVEAELGMKCGILCEKVWFRAQITSLNPLTCLMLDYGYETELPSNQVCVLQKLKEYPNFARQIKIVDDPEGNYQHIKEESQLIVQAVSFDSDSLIHVRVKKVFAEPVEDSEIPSVPATDENIDISTLNTSMKDLIAKKLSTLKSAMEYCQIGSKALLIFVCQVGHNKFSASLINDKTSNKFHSLIDKLPQECLNTKTKNFQPELGQMVCGRTLGNEWYRGLVTSENPVRIAVIDESRIVTPVEIVPIPDEYAQILNFGVICTVSDEQKLEEINKRNSTSECELNCKVIAIKDNKLEIEIFANGEFLTKATLEKWVLLPEQKGVECVSLKNGQEVSLIQVIDQNILYIQSLEKDEKQRCFDLQQNVAKYALGKGKLLDKTPVVGQMVMALYSDNCFYRAIVIKIDEEKILIKYVDYGNEELTSMKKLYTLSDELKEEPSCIRKISLKNVPKEVPMTEEATKYLAELILNEATFTITFDGNLEDGVYLKTTTGEDVNVKVKEFLTPSYAKKAEKDTREYVMYDQLPSLKLGKVGETIDALLLGSIVDNAAYFLCPIDTEAITHVQDAMPKEIMKYVKITKEHYIPVDNELCIAKYMNYYYRGLCVSSSTTPTESRILFVDYGNMENVKHTDIRKMPPDFLKPPQLGTISSTELIPSSKYNDVAQKKLDELMPVNEICKVTIIEYDDDGCIVDFPDVKNKLKAAKLI